MVHLAYKVSHQCRWKFRDSSCRTILLDCIVQEEHSDLWRQVDCVKQFDTWTKSSLQRRIWLQDSEWIHHPLLRHFRKPFRTAFQHPSFSVEHLMKLHVYSNCSGRWEQAKQPVQLLEVTAGVIDLRFPVMSRLSGMLCVRRQEISTTTPAVHDVAGAIRCSRKERRCICKVSDPTCKVTVTWPLATFHTTMTLRQDVSAFSIHEG